MSKNKFNLNILTFALMLAILFTMSLPSGVYAGNIKYSNQEILQMNDKELLSTLLENGMVLPEDYDSHRELSLHFVSKYVPIILSGNYDATSFMFNYDQSNKMMKNLFSTLEKMNVPIVKNQNFYSYTLVDSTPIGSWSDSYENYNCYAYAVGRNSWLIPGDDSGGNFSMTMCISSMADLVLEDLETRNYWGYTTSTKPSELPDKWFKIIAIRKDTDNEDFHFMRRYGSSLNSWAHKPSWTQPLKWNYSSPSSKVWSNEAVADGTVYAPTLTYDSSTYYIIYKSYDDPGIQPMKLITDPEFEVEN